MPGSPRMTRRGISLVVQESANYDSRVFPAQRLARSLENPVPCRPVSATKRGSPIATRDASYPQRSELLESSRLDSRAVRDIFDREHARASVPLQGTSRGTCKRRIYTYVYMYMRRYIPVARSVQLDAMVASCAPCHVQRDHRWPMRVGAQCSSIFGTTIHRWRRAFRNGANVAANEHSLSRAINPELESVALSIQVSRSIPRAASRITGYREGWYRRHTCTYTSRRTNAPRAVTARRNCHTASPIHHGPPWRQVQGE